ncbi:autotransporter-associated beta strand repeat-containing protein [Devosia sp. A369]
MLRPDSGTAIVDAALTGTGRLIKSGSGAVVLTNDNDFTGSVVIAAGVLELRNGNALADTSAVSIANVAGATLLLTDSETIGSLLGGGSEGGSVQIADGMTLTVGDETDTTFLGTIGGETAALVKQGVGTLTLGGGIMLGGLSVTGGTLQIGTGMSTDMASFESATIDHGATLYVAEGATLTIRVPNNIVNNGHLINFGTVHDDLDNAAAFDNYAVYNADIASNTSDINNHAPGVWTGKVLTNAGQINNLSGAHWVGDVVSNNGGIRNAAGASWIGDLSTNGGVSNSGTWTGNVLAAYDQIHNENGAHWVGDIVGNSNAIFNKAGGSWSGSVIGNGGGGTFGQIHNYGTWINGTVAGNAGMILNLNGSWSGDIRGNSDFISNNTNESVLNPNGVNQGKREADPV